MYRVTKAVAAEFSYFIEKYFGADSICWTLIFIAAAYGIILAAIIQAVKMAKKKDINAAYPAASLVLYFAVNSIVKNAQTWDSKLQRVMESWNYIMGFESNYSVFFQALGLEQSEANIGNIFRIAMFLNEPQWEAAEEAFADAGWYIEKVHAAFSSILKIGSCHMSLAVTYQGIAAYTPLILIALLAAALVYRKKYAQGGITLACAACCLIGTFGASIFLCAALYLQFPFVKLASIRISPKNKGKGKPKPPGGEAEIAEDGVQEEALNSLEGDFAY